MADVFENRLQDSMGSLRAGRRPGRPGGGAARAPVRRLRRLQEGDGLLKPGDIAIFATPPAFRWVHFTYAVEKG